MTSKNYINEIYFTDIKSLINNSCTYLLKTFQAFTQSLAFMVKIHTVAIYFYFILLFSDLRFWAFPYCRVPLRC